LGKNELEPLVKGLGHVEFILADSAVLPPVERYHDLLLKFEPLVYSTEILRLLILSQTNGVVSVTPYQFPVTLLKEMGPL
jgi:hypothetical protein